MKSHEFIREDLGTGIISAIFIAALIGWWKKGKDDIHNKQYKVLVNSQDVSSKILSRNEALAVIRHLADRESNPDTYYTIVNVKTNVVVFRHCISGRGNSESDIF